MDKFFGSFKKRLKLLLEQIDGEGNCGIDDSNNDVLEEPQQEVVGFCHVCGVERYDGENECYNCRFKFNQKTRIAYCPKCGEKREPDANECEQCHKSFVPKIQDKSNTILSSVFKGAKHG